MADPRPLTEILSRTLEEQGLEATVAQYRDLRARFLRLQILFTLGRVAEARTEAEALLKSPVSLAQP